MDEVEFKTKCYAGREILPIKLIKAYFKLQIKNYFFKQASEGLYSIMLIVNIWYTIKLKNVNKRLI